MQGSFGDIYNKLYNDISQDIQFITSLSLNDDYEIISSSDISTEDEFIIITDSDNDTNTKNKIHMFDISQYLNKIEKSLNTENKRMDQFNLDFNRSEMYLNGKYIRGKDYFINYIKKNFNQISNFNNMFMYDIMIMICNQASFVFPFILMNNIYSNQNKGIYVTSNNIQYFIKNTKDNLIIELVGIFNIKNVNIDKIVGSVKVTTKFDIDYDKNKKIYKFPKLGIIYWEDY